MSKYLIFDWGGVLGEKINDYLNNVPANETFNFVKSNAQVLGDMCLFSNQPVMTAIILM